LNNPHQLFNHLFIPLLSLTSDWMTSTQFEQPILSNTRIEFSVSSDME